VDVRVKEKGNQGIGSLVKKKGMNLVEVGEKRMKKKKKRNRS